MNVIPIDDFYIIYAQPNSSCDCCNIDIYSKEIKFLFKYLRNESVQYFCSRYAHLIATNKCFSCNMINY